MSGDKADTRIPTPSLSTYDVLGYLLPAIALLSSIYAFEVMVVAQRGQVIATPVSSLLRTTLGEATDTARTILYILTGLMLLYVVGHVISAVSSLVLDRILVTRVFGYPYQSLLFPDWPRTFDTASAQFWMCIFFWVNAYLGVRSAEWLLPNRWLGHLANPLGWALVILILWKIIWRRAQLAFLKHNGRTSARIENWCLMIPFRVLAMPARLAAQLLSDTINPRRHFDDGFIDLFRRRYESTFDLRLPPKKPIDPRFLERATNTYWLPYCFVATRCPTLGDHLQSWLRLYSFSRNISAAFFVAFAYVTSIVAWYHPPLEGARTMIRLFPLCLLALALVMLVRYYYLYFGYYSKFLFRAFTYSVGDLQQSGLRSGQLGAEGPKR
jgi:hypothetical protein